MNERTREGAEPAFELPPQEGWEKHLEKSVEGQLGKDNPSAAKTTHSTPQAQTPSVPQGPVTAQLPIQDNTVVASPTSSDPVISTGDSDRIEKQWVDRAKSVIARTKDDPHSQKKQMSLVKAEYLKARFNKLIKVEEAG